MPKAGLTMTLKEFASNYYLHDSFIESLVYDRSNAVVTLVIGFAFWMQKDFVEGDAENGLIEVTFHNVANYERFGGDPAGDFVGILNAIAYEDSIVISLFDDVNEVYIEMRISSTSVDVRKLWWKYN